MSARVIVSGEVLNIGICTLYSVSVSERTVRFPSCPFWSSPKHIQTASISQVNYRGGGRFCYFCYFVVFSARPLCDLSTQTSPSGLTWLNWPKQWQLGNYCCEFNSQSKELWRNNPLANCIWGLCWKGIQGFCRWFLSYILIPLPLSCCQLTVIHKRIVLLPFSRVFLKSFPNVITVYEELLDNTVW